MSARPRKTSKQPPATKMCLKCNHVRRLSDFYANKDWLEQGGRDVWCKSCVSKCKTKDEVREYFWNNNRKFTDKIWESAKKKAEKVLINVPAYQRASEDRKETMLQEMTCQQVPSVMSLDYVFVDNSQNIHVQTYEEAKEAGQIVETKKDPNVKTYSPEFNGDFKPAELAYLQEYYSGLESDFDLSDTSLRDNAKKLAKASLLVDKVQNDYMAGRCSLQDVKDAIAQYDLLLKTGNFAACKRKPEDKAGIGSWSEISFYCETHGHPMTRKIEWPKDDVDRTIDEFRYLLEALDLGK